MQKMARVKGQRKKRGKGQEKSLKQAMTKKNNKSKFWLMRMYQIKIFHIFMPNLGKIYQFGQKIAFSVKLRPI